MRLCVFGVGRDAIQPLLQKSLEKSVLNRYLLMLTNVINKSS